MDILELKVEPMNRQAVTPKWVLYELQDKMDQIESVIVLAKFKDGFSAVLSSDMNIDRMCVLKEILQRNIWDKIDIHNAQSMTEGRGDNETIK